MSHQLVSGCSIGSLSQGTSSESFKASPKGNFFYQVQGKYFQWYIWIIQIKHTSSQKFHVGSITIITCGLDILTSQIKIKANGRLLKDPLPLLLAERKIFIQQLKDHGCYLQKTIKIDTSWSHDNVTTHLHSWFPKVFEHFDLHYEQANTASHIQPDWQLLVPNNGKLKLSTAIHPNRIVLAHFKGHQKASIADITQNLVPLAVFNKWKVELDIVGMDIKVMSGEGSEVIELSSSVAELNINTVAETVNENALPTWPCQPAGPISGPVMVKELLSDSDDNTPPNPWSAQFDQMTLLKYDDVSDIDL
ncbi:hypothetical protein BKA82DRAFT_4016252 [Pisolithus tinctorius]|nr:hypothetical protein BKA82DRAFT_4016252 [Pisolithus tinctorius]